MLMFTVFPLRTFLSGWRVGPLDAKFPVTKHVAMWFLFIFLYLSIYLCLFDAGDQTPALIHATLRATLELHPQS